MKEETKEWLKRAEDDLPVARRESRVTEEPSYSAVCFHSEQAVEKFLKAFLQEHDMQIIKTHDLVFLLEQLFPLKPLWSVYRDGCERLTGYAVDTRYPGEETTKKEADYAVKFAAEIRDVIRKEIE
jgi:HEPN domain-containing protein